MKSGMSRLRLLAVAGATLTLAACVDDDEVLMDAPTAVNGTGTNGIAYFERYVSLGNSITAGLQGGGLVDTLQDDSYAAILAQRAGLRDFGTPGVSQPGCPVPFVAPLTPAPDTIVANCSLTPQGAQSAVSRNVAVPGARLIDLLRLPSPASSAGRANLLLVGPRTQVQAMREAQPTFVSVWIGNNDALEAAVSGVLGPLAPGADSTLTPLATFQAQLNQLVDSIIAVRPRGVLLVGVVDAARAAPILQPGAYFFIASQPTGGRFSGKTVNPNCSPVTGTGASNPLSRNMVSFRIVADAAFPEINCDPNAYPVGDPRRGVHLLDTGEQAIIAERVGTVTTTNGVPATGYNAAIRTAAINNGWAYADPNVIFNTFLTQTTNPPANTGTLPLYQRVRKCQNLARPGLTADQLGEAVLKSCPNPGAVPRTGTTNIGAPNFFGSLFSFDGVHPSSEAHRILAGRFSAIINTTYTTTLPTAES